MAVQGYFHRLELLGFARKFAASPRDRRTV